MAGLTESEKAGISSSAGVDPRGADRFPMRSFVRICRFEKGGTELVRGAQGRGLSATGMAFVTSEPLALGTQIHVELPKSGLSALARVRSCQPRECGFRVGVELQGSFA